MSTVTAPSNLNSTPSTSGWDIVYAVSLQTVNGLLQQQFAQDFLNATSYPVPPIDLTTYFPLIGGTGCLIADSILLSPPTLSIAENGLDLSFQMLSGSITVAWQIDGEPASLLTYVSLTASPTNVLSGTVPLVGQLSSGTISFDLSGSQNLATGLQVPGPLSSVFGTAMMSVLGSGSFAAAFDIGQLTLPLGGAYNPELLDFAIQTTGGSDPGRLLYLVATPTNPLGGTNPLSPALLTNCFTAGTSDVAMLYSYDYVLTRLAGTLNANMPAAEGIDYDINTGGATPTIDISADLNITYDTGGKAKTYTYSETSGWSTISTTLSGYPIARLMACTIGLIPGAPDAALPVGLYTPSNASSSTTSFSLGVTQTVDGRNQNIPDSCTVQTYSTAASTAGIGADSTDGSTVQLQQQAGLAIYAFLEDTGDGSFDRVAGYSGFNADNCAEALMLPELYNYVVPQLNTQFANNNFFGPSTLVLPGGLIPSLTASSLPGDLWIAATSGATQWGLSPTFSMLAEGESQQFTAVGFNNNSAPAVQWGTRPAQFAGTVDQGLFTASSVTSPAFGLVTAAATEGSGAAYAVVAVMPSVTTITPLFTVINWGQSSDFAACYGADANPEVSWTTSGQGTLTPSGATAQYQASNSEGTTPLEVVSITATVSGSAAMAYILVVDTTVAPGAMAPLQSSTGVGGASVPLSIQVPENYQGTVNWTLYPSGSRSGLITPGTPTNTASYTPPVTDPGGASFNVFAVACDSDNAFYGVAVITVSGSGNN